MGRAKLVWSAVRLVAATTATIFLVHSYTVHRSSTGSFRNTPLVLVVTLWLLVGTLSIDSAPAAGPGAREFFFAAVSMLAGLAATGAVVFDVHSLRGELLTAGALLIAGVFAASRFVKSGKYRSGCAAWIFFLIAIGCLIWATNMPGLIPFLFIPVVLFIGSIGNLVKSTAAQKTMVVESARAEQLASELAAGHPTERFFLFLRPFYVTRTIQVPNPRKSSIVLSPAFYVSDLVDWEALFAEQVERFGRFVALGSATEAVGASRIATSDREWRKTFVRLATFADAIFIIPSTRAGTLFEIEWLRDHGWLGKAIFVWPAGFDSVAERHGEKGADILQRVGAADMAARGAAEGALYTLGPDGRVDTVIAPLPIQRRSWVASALTQVISRVRTDGFADFDRSLRRCQSSIDALPPEVDDVPELEQEPESEPEVDLTGLTCVQCGRLLDDGFVCPACDRDH